MASVQVVRLQVAEECGVEFREELTLRLAGTPVEVRPLDRSPADAVVVGGWDVEADVRHAVDVGARWIQALTAGVDRVLAAGADERAVVITNGSEATARPVSEFVMARVLEHAKQLPVIAEQQRRREWHTRWLGSLARSTITVVGLGPVGSRVARLARAFEMHVVGVRRSPDRGHEACDVVLGGSQLGEALSSSDYCVLAAALTPETRGMVSETVLARARQGLFLVNVGRGELVDDDALRRAVSEGRITAALDVFSEEPLPADSDLWDVSGIAVSPHTATLTPPLIGWLVDLVEENALRFAEGRPLRHVVDTALGYPAFRTADS